MKLSQEIERHLVYTETPIREAVVKRLSASFDVVLEELEVELGRARIDLALVGKHLHGFELKSDGDSLTRLPHQISYYSQVFDKVTIVTGYSHIYDVMDMVPSWWGVIVVEKNHEDDLCLLEIRTPKLNPHLNPHTLTNLLVRWEALNILSETGNIKGFRSRSSHVVRDHLATSLELEDLKYHVKKALTARTNHRVAAL